MRLTLQKIVNMKVHDLDLKTKDEFTIVKIDINRNMAEIYNKEFGYCQQNLENLLLITDE